MKTVVSVDWDYFLPHEIDSYDWGHNEGNYLFYEFLWPMRAGNRSGYAKNGRKTALETIQIDPKRCFSFWSSILATKAKSALIVDSHKDIVDFVSGRGDLRIINFDAHHDFSYRQEKVVAEPKELNCGNWGSWLKLRTMQLKHYTLVYPAWRKAHPELTTWPLKQNIETVVYGDWKLPKINADYIFLCRSSCWMPSWCDEQWLTLSGMLQFWARSIRGCSYVGKARPFAAVPEMEVAQWQIQHA